jgi:hypothetical protein
MFNEFINSILYEDHENTEYLERLIEEDERYEEVVRNMIKETHLSTNDKTPIIIGEDNLNQEKLNTMARALSLGLPRKDLKYLISQNIYNSIDNETFSEMFYIIRTFNSIKIPVVKTKVFEWLETSIPSDFSTRNIDIFVYTILKDTKTSTKERDSITNLLEQYALLNEDKSQIIKNYIAEKHYNWNHNMVTYKKRFEPQLSSKKDMLEG